MSEKLTIQRLIDQLKKDLFAPYEGAKLEGKSVYPLFFIDEVELELAVDISYSVEAGIKVTLLQTVESGVAGKAETTQAHRIKVKLSPILTREELRELLDADTRLLAGIKKASLAGIVKSAVEK